MNMPERVQRTLSIQIALAFWLTACGSLLGPVQSDWVLEENTLPEATQTSINLPDNTPSPTPTPPDYLMIAREAAARGAFDEALDALKTALDANPNNDQAYLQRGNIYIGLGDLEAASKDLNRAIKLNDENAQALYSRALVNVEQAAYEAALADFGAAIDLAPSFGLAYRNRAEVHIQLGRYEAAVLDLQIYLSLVPNAPDQIQIGGQILALQGEQKQASDENGLLFFDDFSNEDSGWYANGDPALLAYYDAGGYRLIHPQANAAGWALPGRLFTNIRVEVQAEKQAGLDDNFFGLMCRVQGTTGSANFYIFMISSDGYYGIGKRVDGGALELIGQEKMQKSNAINTVDAVNAIQIECDGDRLALFVNEQLVAEEHDEALSTGQIGLVVGTFSEGGTNILFDDLAVYALDGVEE